MSFGDHLDELRRRILFALIGVAVAVGACLFLARHIVALLCQPLLVALSMAGQTPRLYQEQVPQLLLNYMEISVMAGLCLASPWVIYQVWRFVSAGLYASERRNVKRYGLMSLALFLAGAAFMYLIVLPFALKYFVEFTELFRPPEGRFLTPVQSWLYSDRQIAPDAAPASQPDAVLLPVREQPPEPQGVAQAWFDPVARQIRVMDPKGGVWTVPVAPRGLVAPLFNLADYIKFAITLMFIFGIGFQTPLVILFLAKTGIASTQAMARSRRVVILALFVVAAVITPPDVISQVLLAIPMWGLFELGLVLGRRAERAAANRRANSV